MRNPILPILCALVLAACADRDAVPGTARELAPPAGPGAAQPFVASDGDDVILSWTEPTEGGHALRFARWDGAAWSEAATVAQGRDWFVNWADFPSVVAVGNGRLAAHWLQRSGPGRYAYDVMLTQSADGGRTWAEAVRPHRDNTETEHGFVSLFPHGGDIGVVWLDGRHFAATDDAPATNRMMLLSTGMSGDGALSAELPVDTLVCDCCQTGVALARSGPVLVYRDRSPDEVRDIFTSRLTAQGWTQPRPVHRDGWTITGCPVNGPAVAASGDDVVVAWFTAAADTPRVRVAFSRDAGDSFAEPLRIDEGDPVGRVDVVALGPGRAFVVWLERRDEGADVLGRVVSTDNGAGPVVSIARTGSGRSSGFPRMALRGRTVVLAWTDAADPSAIRAVEIDLQ